MRAVDHYVEAEICQSAAADCEGRGELDVAALNLQHAQVHATLALAGATALQSYTRMGDEASDAELDDWQVAAGGEA